MKISESLNLWYQEHHRDLPWRHTRDPYFIWLSEVILQQTRVEQGRSYYHAFTETFPTVTDLALASEDQVLKLWQGLGYYSRARNLHAAAQYIHGELLGSFPQTYKGILQLKGVGPYTASAIASICFDLPHAVVDGNVYRVLSRLFGIHTPIDSSAGIKEFNVLANELMGKQSPGMHNQAMMEFGALHCTPKNPKCDSCPLSGKCVAFAQNEVGLLPVKEKKIKQKERHFQYLRIRQGQHIFIRQRKEKDIWQGLFEFPLIETQVPPELPELTEEMAWKELFGTNIPTVKGSSETFKHLLTHQRIFARFWEISLPEDLPFEPADLKRILPTEIQQFALPRLMEIFINKHPI